MSLENMPVNSYSHDLHSKWSDENLRNKLTINSTGNISFRLLPSHSQALVQMSGDVAEDNFDNVIHQAVHRTMLTEWQMLATFRVEEIGTGFGIGIKQPEGGESLFLLFRAVTGDCEIVTAFNNPFVRVKENNLKAVVLKKSNTSFSVKKGDIVRLSLVRQQRSIEGHIEINHSFPFHITYSEDISYPAPTLTGHPNRFHLPGYPCVVHNGGNYLVKDFSFISSMIDDPQMVIVGDSGSEGYYAGNLDNGYVNLIKKAAGENFKINTYCVAGSTISDGLASVSEWLKGRGSYILLALGGNDIALGLKNKPFGKTPDEALEAYDQLVSQCLEKGCIPIICTTIPANLKPTHPLNRNLRKFRDLIIKKYDQALYKNLVIVDAYNELKMPGHNCMNPSYSSGDAVHPGKLGHAMIASYIVKKLNDHGFSFATTV
jgi:lysophospholipase L1-like esterase